MVFGINVGGVTNVSFFNNKFSNLKCPETSDIRMISGVVNFFGFSTFSKTNNNFSISAENNSFINCSCYSGGSLGVINYHIIEIKNILFMNSKAKRNGGSIFIVSCDILSLINVYFENSTAKNGGVLYINNIFLLLMTECKIKNYIGDNSGAIHWSNSITLNLESIIFDSGVAQ